LTWIKKKSRIYKNIEDSLMTSLLLETNTTNTKGLTSGFGMRPGVSPLLWPSSIFRVFEDL